MVVVLNLAVEEAYLLQQVIDNHIEWISAGGEPYEDEASIAAEVGSCSSILRRLAIGLDQAEGGTDRIPI